MDRAHKARASDTAEAGEAVGRPRSGIWRRRIFRGTGCAVGAVWIFAVQYVAAVFLGARIPVNSDYVEADSGIQIFVATNGWHTDFVLPARNAIHDWCSFAPLSSGHDTSAATHVFVGWGDRAFYLETPTEAEFSYVTGARAMLLPTATVAHVSFYPWQPRVSERCVRLFLTDDEYRRLVDFVVASFRTDEKQKLIPIACEHRKNEEYFEGTGSYHLFYTCNNWANRALQETGVRTPLWSPLDQPIFDQLRQR